MQLRRLHVVLEAEGVSHLVERQEVECLFHELRHLPIEVRGAVLLGARVGGGRLQGGLAEEGVHVQEARQRAGMLGQGLGRLARLKR